MRSREERLRDVIARLRKAWSPSPHRSEESNVAIDLSSVAEVDGGVRPDRAAVAGTTRERANRLCGDLVRVTVPTAAQTEVVPSLIVDARGCSICTASAELMKLAVSGRSWPDAEAVVEDVLATIESGAPFEREVGDESLRADLDSLGAVALHPARRGCAALPWEAIRDALIDSAGGGR